MLSYLSRTEAPIVRLAEVIIVSVVIFMIGVGIGGANGFRIFKETEHALPIDRAVNFAGKMAEDSVLYAEYARHAIIMQSIAVGNIRTSTSGRVVCFASGDAVYLAGTAVSGALTITEREERGDYVCSLHTIGEREQSAEWRISSLLRAIRQRSHRAIGKVLERYPTSSAHLLYALVLGKRERLHPQIVEFFRSSGSSHTLALSGMHLAIIISSLYILFSRICNQRVTYMILIVFVALYLFIIGVKPSLERAGIMFAIWVILKYMHIRIATINILALSFILFTVLRPTVITDLSFQLSYAALAGIILLSPPIRAKLQFLLPKQISLPLAAATGAQVVALPLLSARFNILYPVGILSSLVLAPLIVLFIWYHLALIPLMVLPIDIVHGVVYVGSAIIYQIIIVVAAFFSGFPAIVL